MRCSHELIQLSGDGERFIVCGDCGREFGQIARDDGETLIAFASKEHAVIVAIVPADGKASRGMAVTTTGSGHYATTTVHPCAACGWLGSCEDGCHS